MRCAPRSAELDGAYALAVMSQSNPDLLVLARCGCPVVIGVGEGEHFVASDVSALLPVTRQFVFLEEGDVAEIRKGSLKIIDKAGNSVHRPVRQSELSADAAEKGEYPHYMLKEIHEQPRAVAQTLEERVANGKLLEAAFGPDATDVFRRTRAVHIVACGTSFHAGSVARYLIEQVCRIPCYVEIASEFRYRNPVVTPNTLFVTISQSGRNRRHAGRAASGEGRRLSRHTRHLQRAGKLAGARIGSGDADARRPGDRRGLDQGLHHADRRAQHAGDRARQTSRHGCRARARPGHAPDRNSRPHRQDPGARQPR